MFPDYRSSTFFNAALTGLTPNRLIFTVVHMCCKLLSRHRLMITIIRTQIHYLILFFAALFKMFDHFVVIQTLYFFFVFNISFPGDSFLLLFTVTLFKFHFIENPFFNIFIHWLKLLLLIVYFYTVPPVILRTSHFLQSFFIRCPIERIIMRLLRLIALEAALTENVLTPITFYRINR